VMADDEESCNRFAWRHLGLLAEELIEGHPVPGDRRRPLAAAQFPTPRVSVPMTEWEAGLR
jgi:hypothetical protein